MLEDNRRQAFLSLSFLVKQYKSIPAEVLSNSIFVFNAKRSWLFPTGEQEVLEAKNRTEKYIEYDEDFKSLILQQEKQHLVYWFLPDKNYLMLSSFLEAMVDPVANDNYLPLILDPAWWESEFSSDTAKYTSDIQAIVKNFKAGEFDYDALMELLYQSNPTLVPTLYWQDS